MRFKTTVFGLLSGIALATSALAEGIEVHDPYAISTGMTAQTGAAFMAIHNHGDSDDALIDVRSDAARLVQLHTHLMDANGVMSMIHVTDPVAIPAGGQMLLERGGYHVMFMGLTGPLTDDAMIPVTLVFQKAGDVLIDVPVDLDRLHDNMDMNGMDMSGN